MSTQVPGQVAAELGPWLSCASPPDAGQGPSGRDDAARVRRVPALPSEQRAGPRGRPTPQSDSGTAQRMGSRGLLDVSGASRGHRSPVPEQKATRHSLVLAGSTWFCAGSTWFWAGSIAGVFPEVPGAAFEEVQAVRGAFASCRLGRTWPVTRWGSWGLCQAGRWCWPCPGCRAVL